MNVRKTLSNKKITLGLLTILLIFLIIVVSSFWPFIIDPSKLSTTEFLTDELIITAIILSTTISILFVAQASNASKPESEIARAKVEFAKSMSRIERRTDFFQWVKKVLQPRDREEMAKREADRLMLPREVLSMEPWEIVTLVERVEIGGRHYGPYPLKTLKRAILTKERIARMSFVAPNYYTSVTTMQADRTLSEMAKNENAKKVSTTVLQLSLRIAVTWIGAFILGSLVRDMTQDGGSTAQAWMRFLSRAFAFGSSCFLGYYMGCQLNDLDAAYISKRVEVHSLYLEDKAFVPEEE